MSNSMIISPHDIPQLFTPDKPILIVDADEVLLQFVKHLEAYLIQKGYELRLQTFGLTGNIYRLRSDMAVEGKEVSSLIADFFQACIDDIPVVAGAQEALGTLERHYQIAVLTNIADHLSHRRAQCLANNGIDYPLIANSGGKGQALKMIADHTQHHCVFIDDLPPQHSAAARHAPKTHRIHFIADERLSKLIPKADDAHVRLYSWPEITDYMIDFGQFRP